MDKETQEHILNILRRGTITWRGRSECLKRHRVKVREGSFKSGKPKYKYYWVCAVCKRRYRDQEMMEVDHIVEVGPFKGSLNKFVERLYCGQDNLQALCIVCHSKKTSGFNSTRLHERKKTR